jgi:hypothetical protein
VNSHRHATHAIELLHEVKALTLVGDDDAIFLAAAAGGVLHVMISRRQGELAAGAPKGLRHMHSRTRVLEVASLAESAALTEQVLNDDAWQPLERIALAMPPAAALGHAACAERRRALVAAGAPGAGVAAVVDLSRWQTAVKARQLLEAWLQAVMHRRWLALLRDLIEEETTLGGADHPLLLDAAAAAAAKARAAQEKVLLADRLSHAHAASDAAGAGAVGGEGEEGGEEDGDAVAALHEQHQEVGAVIEAQEAALEEHAAAKKELLAAALDTIKLREPHAAVTKSALRALLTKALRRRALERLIAAEPPDGDAAARAQLAQLDARQASLLGTDR